MVQQKIVVGGGLGRLVAAIEAHPLSRDVQEQGCRAMMNMAGLTSCDMLPLIIAFTIHPHYDGYTASLHAAA